CSTYSPTRRSSDLPLPVDAAVRVDQEDAALDAHVAAAVEDLLADHAEGDAECLVAVAGELERELVPGAEVGVALHRVARDAQHLGAGLAQLRVQRGKVLAFAGAARGVVLRVEVQHQPAAAVVAEGSTAAVAQRQRKVGNGIAGAQHAVRACSGMVRGIRTSPGPGSRPG